MKKILFSLLFVAFGYALPTQTIHSDKLRQRVVVDVDRYGIPHIVAKNAHDLYFVQGYLTASDRLFQMDYYRRLARGETAEILGQGRLEQDFKMRLLGFRDQARAIYQHSPDKVRAILKAYAEGVNSYIDENAAHLPPEYEKLQFYPKRWQAEDSLLFGRVMSWRLSSTLGDELDLAKLVQGKGQKFLRRVLNILPADPIRIQESRLLRESYPKGFLREAENQTNELSRLSDRFYFFSQLSGSNNWVVAKKKSKSNAPILANDPHLSLTTPPIWHEVHLKMPGLNVIGVTFPGIPGVIIGHNEHIAWGVTTTGFDVLDIYIDTLDSSNPEQYRFRGRALPIKKRIEKIRVRQGKDLKVVTREILYTQHGPVLFKLAGKLFTFKWTGQKPTFEVQAFLKMMQAKNLKQFQRALRYFKVGAQNFLYADTQGHIFWQATGEVPIRPAGCVPYLPLIGKNGKCEWQGAIPYEKLPHLLDPRQGFIVTANNAPVGNDYPYYHGFFYDAGFRADEITRRLQRKEKLSFKEVQAIQMDDYSIPAEKIVPQILAAFEGGGETNSSLIQKVLQVLKNWDFHTTTESSAPTIFYSFLKAVSINTLEDDLGKSLFRQLGGDKQFLFALLIKPSGEPFFDDLSTEKRETKSEILRTSLKEAMEELQEKLGSKIERWRWGKQHTLTLRHPFLKEYDLGPFSLPGAIHTVNHASFGIFGDFSFGGGPSLRFVAELKGRVAHAENVIPGGQSGLPHSHHHTDQLKLWLKGKARPMFFSNKAISKNSEQKILFLP